jgi:2-dehydro-3-deoxyphosphogluconate aldolase/(4S)-4-hydroxy-2-oxoglutarate aldolase
MTNDELGEKLSEAGVAAVLTAAEPADAVAAARALAEGGIEVIELTLRTPSALESIRRIRAEVPSVLLGAGTVLGPAQLAQAAQAGAQFGLAPGWDLATVRAARAAGLPFIPGVMTPSELQAGVAEGCRLFKFFPAVPAGGASYLESMAAPFAHLQPRFVPLGGIGPGTMGAFLSLGCVSCVAGSWMAAPALLAARQWGQVRSLAADSVAIARSARPRPGARR